MRPLLVLVLVLSAVAAGQAADEPPAPARNAYALLLGENLGKAPGRQLPGALKYAERDAEGLADTLVRSGYPQANVIVLTQSRGKRDRSLEPTAQNFAAQLDRLLDRLRDDDVLLIGLAGHGLKDEGGIWFFPAGADLDRPRTLINLTRLQDDLEKHPKGRKVIFADSCRRSATRELPIPSPQKGLGLEGDGGARPVGKRVWWLHSCSDGQVADEDDRLEHGVFFSHLIEGLKGHAARGSNRYVTLADVDAYVREQLEKASPKQTPLRRGVMLDDAWLVECTPVLKPVGQLSGHRNDVIRLRVSPDGRRALSSDRDHVHVWDLSSRRQPRLSIPNHYGRFPNLDFSPAGTELVAGTGTGAGSNPSRHYPHFKVYSTLTGASRSVGSEERITTALAVDPTGRTIATALNNPKEGSIIRVWDYRTLVPVQTLKVGQTDQDFLAFSPNGKYLACGSKSDTAIKVWNVAQESIEKTLALARRNLLALRFTPDGGELIAVTADRDGVVQAFDWRRQVKPTRVAAWPAEPDIGRPDATCGAVSADGRMAATGSLGDHSVVFWDVATMRVLAKYKEHQKRVHSVAIAPDCSSALSGGDQGEIVYYARK